MYWALDLDDFTGGNCNQGTYPLIRAVNAELDSGTTTPTTTTTQAPETTRTQAPETTTTTQVPETTTTLAPETTTITQAPVTTTTQTPETTQATTQAPTTTQQPTEATTESLETTTTEEGSVTTSEPVNPTTYTGHCYAIGAWEGDAEMDEWCQNDCEHGYCPSDMCECDGMTTEAGQTTTTSEPVNPTTYTGHCYAIGAWEGDAEMDEWCQDDCEHGYCPSDMCECDG